MRAAAGACQHDEAFCPQNTRYSSASAKLALSRHAEVHFTEAISKRWRVASSHSHSASDALSVLAPDLGAEHGRLGDAGIQRAVENRRRRAAPHALRLVLLPRLPLCTQTQAALKLSIDAALGCEACTVTRTAAEPAQ